MQLHIETSAIDKLSADALAVICFEAPEKEEPVGDPEIAAQDGWLTEMRAAKEFSGKLYEIAILHRPRGLAAKRLVVIGGGKRDKFSTVEARRLAGVLVRTLKAKGARTIALLMEKPGEFASAVAEGAVLGGWE